MGMAPITRDGFDFEVTIALDIDQQHKAFCTKDRSGLFQDRKPFIITPETGRKILDWCNRSEDIKVDAVFNRIGDCRSIQELLDLYKQYPQFKEVLKPEFEQQKRNILINQDATTQLANQSIIQNGKH